MNPPKKVLVVEDDAHIRLVAELKLKNAGYDVLSAGDGEEGLEIIKAHQPDAVITDLNLPKMDGRDLCQATDFLKAERPFLTVVVTGHTSEGAHPWLQALHDTAFLPKPFSPARLLECLDGYFGIQRDD